MHPSPKIGDMGGSSFNFIFHNLGVSQLEVFGEHGCVYVYDSTISFAKQWAQFLSVVF